MTYECPIDRQMRLWLEAALGWLIKEFDEDKLVLKKTLTPGSEDFPVLYDGSKESLIKTAEIIASQMDIDFSEINLEIFKESIHQIPGDYGHTLFTEHDKSDDNEQLALGLYFGKNEEGRYDIFIEEKNLENPEQMVAILAHEFAHIKLLGEGRIEDNNEHLTDLTTVVFGLGIFNANSAFNFHKSYDGWSYNEAGYLKQKEWGYSLALFSYFKNEHEPFWLQYLNKNLQSDFKKSIQFMNSNQEKIFNEQYHPE